MKKRILFLRGITAFALVFTLVLAAGCGNDPQEVTGRVSIAKIADPKVTVKTVVGGVMLSWPPVIDAEGYAVWRSGGGQPAAVWLSQNREVSQDADGMYRYFDVVGFENNLKPNTQYTYTVIAAPVSRTKDIGKTEEKIKTGTFPAQGSQAAAPAKAELTIDYGAKSISVTVTPPAAGNIPNVYWIAVVKDGNWDNYLTNDSKFYNPAAPVTWTKYAGNDYDSWLVNEYLQNPGGKFEVIVNASLGDNVYYREADSYKVTKTIEPLFGQKGLTGYPYKIYGTGADSLTVKGYAVRLNLGNMGFKPGVAYTVERATLGVDNQPGEYAPVTIFKEDNTDGTIEYTEVSLTPDVLGNIAVRQVQDRSLPVKEEKYRYRIKAVKDGVTDYDTADAEVSFGNSIAAQISLLVTKNIAGTEFEITPAYSGDKGLLQDGDKLAVYYVVGAGDSNTNGPYVPADISFTKADLEAATIVGKKLTVPANGTTEATRKYLYVQAFLEFANGKKVSVSNWNGSALSDSVSNYNNSHLGIIVYYVQLNY